MTHPAGEAGRQRVGLAQRRAPIMTHPAGEADCEVLRFHFDRRLKLEFHGPKITFDGGLLAFHELDDVLGLSQMAGDIFADTRTGSNSRHSLIAQFRRSVFGRLAGFEDVDDADRLGRDPTMRFFVGGRAVTAQAASTSQMGRFETEVMTQPDNLGFLASLSGMWIDRIAGESRHAGHGLERQADIRRTRE